MKKVVYILRNIVDYEGYNIECVWLDREEAEAAFKDICEIFNREYVGFDQYLELSSNDRHGNSGDTLKEKYQFYPGDRIDIMTIPVNE